MGRFTGNIDSKVKTCEKRQQNLAMFLRAKNKPYFAHKIVSQETTR
jgi:hypothetical protein